MFPGGLGLLLVSLPPETLRVGPHQGGVTAGPRVLREGGQLGPEEAQRVEHALELHHVAALDAPEGERTGGLAVGRARDAPLRRLHVPELRQAAAADDRDERHRHSFMARISGRLRQ